MDGPAFAAACSYLRDVFAQRYTVAARSLEDAVAAEGLGTINGALADVGRSLLDQIRFSAGTVDVLAEIEVIARRIVEISGADRADEIERQQALIVFLGSEGLPCAARTTVASWPPLDRHASLQTTVVGLCAVVAQRTGTTAGAVADSIRPPGDVVAAPGTFSLAWRDDRGTPSVLSGALPRGQTAHITFLGTGTTSLRSLFARVAHLAAPRPDTDTDTMPRSLGAGVNPTPRESRPWS